MQQNPYNPARPALAAVFVGRQEFKRQLTDGLRIAGMGFSLVGEPGIGKTSLLWAVQRDLAAEPELEAFGPVPLPVYIDCMRHYSKAEEILVSIAQGLVSALSVQRGMSCPFGISRNARLQAGRGRQLTTVCNPLLDWAFAQENRAHLPVLLLDNLHHLHPSQEVARLASFLQTIVNEQLLSLVLAGQRALADELRNDVSPLRALIAYHCTLEPMNQGEVHALIGRALEHGWPVEDGCAGLAYKLTGGHPYRLHYYLFGILSRQRRLTLEGLQAQHTPNTIRHLDTVLTSAETTTERPVAPNGTSIAHIRELTRRDNLEEALDELATIASYRHEADLLTQRLNHVHRQARQGVLAHEAADMTCTEIAGAILRLIS